MGKTHLWLLFLCFTIGAPLSACQGGSSLGKSEDDVGAGLDGVSDGVSGDVAAPPDAPSEDASTPVCPPGLAGCVEGQLLICNEDGSAFEISDCEDGTVCHEGACVECASDEDCEPGEHCDEDNTCALIPLEVITEELPPALEGTPYSTQLEAAGGALPYTWSLDQGDLPTGIELDPSGELHGSTTQVGAFNIKVKVADDGGDSAFRNLLLKVLEHGLHISTASPLPLAEAGSPYSVAFEALGGTTPYFWGIASGSVPTGFQLGSDGVLAGTTEDDGTFTFDVKVFDNSAPTLTSTKTFELPVSIAPLEIIADQEVNLFITKLIVLPLIVVVEGIPVPYSGQLEAKGGKKPYHWAEVPMPGFVSSLIPNAGLPAGLTINDDGSFSGGVTDPSLVVEVEIPFTGITLSGFFFSAEVSDSQPVPDNASALFIIPTVPIGI